MSTENSDVESGNQVEQYSELVYGAPWTLSFQVDTEEFVTQLVDPLSAVVDECRLHIGSEIHALAVEPANVQMVAGTVETISEPDGRATVGFNLSAAKQALADLPSSGTLRITVEGHDDGEITFINHMKETIEAFDPETARQDPERPDEVDYTADIQVDGWKLKGALSGICAAANEAVAISTEAGTLRLEGDDQVGAVAGEWCHEWEIAADAQNKSRSVYSKQYVQNIAESLPVDGPARMKLGDDSLVHVESGAVEYWIAPRIVGGGSDD